MGRLTAAIGLALALAGCAALPMPTPAPAEALDLRDTLGYIDYLQQAGPGELAVIGERLGTDRGVVSRARRALWLATPGHPGHAPGESARMLESLLEEGPALGETTRLLLQVQLRHVRERQQLVQSRAELMARNRELQRQIEELTALERRMGTDSGDDE